LSALDVVTTTHSLYYFTYTQTIDFVCSRRLHLSVAAMKPHNTLDDFVLKVTFKIDYILQVNLPF